ncbi:MAG: hypothetical protein ACTHU0_05240, partial [Kofleriaceae bacterium]
MSCRRVRDWLHRESSSLDEAQRLVLEDHLGDCARCRGDRARMLLLHRVGTSLPDPPPNPVVHGRAIARALLEGPREEVRPRLRRWPLALAALAATATTAVAWHLHEDGDLPVARSTPAPGVAEPSRGAGGPSAPVAPVPSVARPPEDLVELGVVRQGPTELAQGAPAPGGALLHASAPARLRLASAQVVVLASAELRWNPAERQIVLERGALDIDSG